MNGGMKMVRFGIVGTGRITTEFLKSAAFAEEFKLSAVYSRTKERAAEFAALYNAEAVFTDLEAMARSGLIDAVYIASPNSCHAEQAILFLNNGIHVLCEKPMASNPAEIKRMSEAARKKDVLLMEAMMTSFLPNFKVIGQNLYKLGKIRRAAFNYCQYSSRYDPYLRGEKVNTFDPRFSNGSLMDIGVYCVYPAVRFFGLPKAVKASAVKLDSGVDGSGSLIMEYGTFEAAVMHSKITNSYVPSEIQGEKGSMLIDRISQPTDVQIRYRNGESERLTVKQDKTVMYYEIKEFIQLINSGKTESTVNPHKLSTDVSAVIEAVRKQTGILYPADKND